MHCSEVVLEVQHVSQEELDSIAESARIPERIRSRELESEIQAVDESTNKKWKGGRSEHVCYYDAEGRYVCTVHRVFNKSGRRVHWHVKNITVEGVRYGLK